MGAKYFIGQIQAAAFTVLLMTVISCKKENTSPAQSGTPVGTNPVVTATPGPVTLGLSEFASDTNKRLLIHVGRVGTQAVAYNVIFDTGSTGMTLDAHDVIPASMITGTGFSFTGDSTVVNGITITSQTAELDYGGIAGGSAHEYGNLAYANITVGNAGDTLSIKRVSFFLYYKVLDGNGTQLGTHSYDIFGVGPGASFANGAAASPLSYFNAGPGTVSGFKLAQLDGSLFNINGGLVNGLLTVGLTATDLSSEGFIMHPLSAANGYAADIPATITYNNKSLSATVLFDTGLAAVSIIEDKTASIGELQPNSIVKIVTNKGFVYQYVTSSTDNLTTIQNPNATGDPRTIISLDFFITNEYLLDYTDHQIGLKNN